MIGLVLKYKGNRWNVPGNVESHWTIAYVMDLMSNELPSFNNNEVEVLYLRTVVAEKDWSTTTLAQLFGLSKTATGNYCILLQPTKTTSKESSSSSSSSQEAIQVLLQNNFDDDSITCLITICKLVDNVLKSSLDDMSKRTLKSSNKILQQKIFSKVGGLDLITSLGFISNDGVIYTLEKPNITFLLQTRIHIQQTLRQTLHCPTDQLPSSQPPSIPPPPKKQPSNDFNPYVTQNYNTQKGGSNPVLANNNNVSTTERHLQLLQSKQSKLEQQIRLTDRQIIAFPPSTTVTTTYKEETNLKSKSDGSLIAARMKKMEDDRKKREEGGFTTKAMRKFTS